MSDNSQDKQRLFSLLCYIRMQCEAKCYLHHSFDANKMITDPVRRGIVTTTKFLDNNHKQSA
jgi:hypothetical protein